MQTFRAALLSHVPGIGASWPRWVLAMALVLASYSVLGCESCSRTPLAELTEKAGAVDRDTHAKRRNWTTAQVGAQFQMGDAVRTGTAAGATLHLDDGSTLALEEKTIIRFLDKKPGATAPSLDLELGAATLEAAADGTSIETRFGLARLEGGSRVALTRSQAELRYEVLVGAAHLETATGKSIDLGPGQTFEVNLGQAELEPGGPTSKTPASDLDETELKLPIAVTTVGVTAQVQGPNDNSLSPLPEGRSTLSLGSRVVVNPGSSVAVSRGDSTAELAAGGTYILGSGGKLVVAESGSLVVTSSATVRIQVPGGVIETTSGQAQIRALGPDGTEVVAKRGTVTIVGKSQEILDPGETGTLKKTGEVSIKGRGIAQADVVIRSGSSVVIHDPSPPTGVGFSFDGTCDQGIIRVDGKGASLPQEPHARGRRQVTLPLRGGGYAYSLKCIDEAGVESEEKASGRVTIVQDAGSKPVPRQAPTTHVDVNGRTYTVVYQNQLPQVTFAWASAPEDATSFQLHLTGGGRSRHLSSAKPSHTFSSGSLSEGTHTVYFEGGGRVSRKSTVAIVFDNAAPTASISTPVSTGVGPGGGLTINGTALPGWAVAVDGAPIGQDAEGRFSAPTTLPGDGRPVLIYLSHPSRGTHIYLRRPSGGT